MKARIFNLLAFVFVALAAVDLAVTIPSIRSARRTQEVFSGGSILVHDVHYTQFGLEWWVVPLFLIFTATGLFAWNKWSNRRDRNA